MNKLTIVTVVYNAVNEIKKTLDSVLNQNYTCFQYLIIDGASKDGTIKLLENYRYHFNKKGINYSIISEPDSGIYNAMNKGVKSAEGDWILFLNAGDILFNSNTIKESVEKLDDTSQIVYGQTIFTIYGLYKYVDNYNLEEIKDRSIFCHQSTFIRKNLLIESPYDENYRIAGDYDFFLRQYMSKISFTRINQVISIFSLGGTSSNDYKCLMETYRSQYENGVLSKEEYEIKLSDLERNKKKYNFISRIKKGKLSHFINVVAKIKYLKMGYSKYIDKKIS